MRQQGFTAVELLVTLFVATIFMAASYQLYSIIVKDSGDIRSRSRASNIAYAELRRYADPSRSICIARNQAITMPADHKLDQPSGNVQVICHTNGVMEVRTRVEYGPTNAPQQKVEHAVYVAK